MFGSATVILIELRKLMDQVPVVLDMDDILASQSRLDSLKKGFGNAAPKSGDTAPDLKDTSAPSLIEDSPMSKVHLTDRLWHAYCIVLNQLCSCNFPL